MAIKWKNKNDSQAEQKGAPEPTSQAYAEIRSAREQDDAEQNDGVEAPPVPTPTRPAIPQVVEAAPNLEDAFANLFKSSTSGTGEEELLRIASHYSLQLSAKQIRLLLFLEQKAWHYQDVFETTGKYPKTAERLRNFVHRYLELKQHNQSDIFIMKALEFISLRKFLNENSLKVNIEK